MAITLEGGEFPNGLGNLANQQAQAGGIIGGPAREKYWEEMSSDERVGVLRAELVRAYKIMQTMAETINKLELHEHSIGGKIMVPYASENRASSLSSGWIQHPYRMMTIQERKK